MKLFFIDVETTGTNPAKNALIQLSGIVEIDGEEKERIDLLICPFPNDVIDQKALEINRRTKDEIFNFAAPGKVYHEFMDIMRKYIDQYDRSDKFHFIGYNSRFDDDFLRAWFNKCGDKYYGSLFFWPAIDVANIAAIHFINDREKFKNFKLMTVARAMNLEIQESKLHDAMYDIEITKTLFYKLCKHININF